MTIPAIETRATAALIHRSHCASKDVRPPRRSPVSRRPLHRKIKHPLTAKRTMSIDPKSPRITVEYIAVGGPLDGHKVRLDGRTPVFVYIPGVVPPLQGAISAGTESHYRVKEGQLVWVEGENKS